jgi:hypothetical protein
MVGWEKYFFIIKFTKETYNDEAGHCSMNLVLGSSFIVHQLLTHLLLFFVEITKWLQNLGQREIRIWVEFLYYVFPPFKWDSYPFFYMLEGARYLVE